MALLSVLLAFFFLVITFLCISNTITATIADDEKECADQLQNLFACIPYVSGTTQKPTHECCDNAEKVRKNMPKCLCILIIESTDAALNLPINTTLALQMPSACNSNAKIADCPSILKLSHDSPYSKIFEGTSYDSSNKTVPNAATGNVSDAKSSVMNKGKFILIVSFAVLLML